MSNINTEDSKTVDSLNDNENKLYYSNLVELEGYVDKGLKYHHSTHGEDIYSLILRVPRSNKEVSDYLPIEVSSRATDIDKIHEGDLLRILGQFRSFNKINKETNKASLQLSVFVRDIDWIKEDECTFKNSIVLNGHLCKNPIYRVTPSGREISDIILAVNRIYGRSDYIPCIAWSRNARFMSGLSIGESLSIRGRIQSRVYHKKIKDTEDYKENTVYEVSVSSVSVNQDDEQESAIIEQE